MAEMQNNSLVSALLLTISGMLLIDPPGWEGVEGTDPRVRVFVYANFFSTVCNVMVLGLSIMLLYQLNMLPGDKEVRMFIVKLGEIRPPLGSHTGMPDVLQSLLGGACFSLVLSALAAVHINYEPVDAWVMTGIAVLFSLVFGMLVGSFDQWKWTMLEPHMIKTV